MSRMISRIFAPVSAVVPDNPVDVAARPRQAGDEPRSDRIAHSRHDDRNCACRLPCRGGGRRLICDDDVDLEPDELIDQRAQAIWLAVRRAELELNVLSLDIAMLAQPIPEYAPERLWIGRHKNTNPWQLGLLRTRGERRQRGAAAAACRRAA